MVLPETNPNGKRRKLEGSGKRNGEKDGREEEILQPNEKCLRTNIMGKWWMNY